jgi:hypothetical protein
MKSIEITAALVVVAVASVLVSTSTLAPVVLAQEDDRDQATHGSASSDPTGRPQDPDHWGDSSSDFGNDGIMGSHSREGSAPGDAPFDERDDTKGRIGVGNNDGDGPSGHAACVDGDPETEDPLCLN